MGPNSKPAVGAKHIQNIAPPESNNGHLKRQMESSIGFVRLSASSPA